MSTTVRRAITNKFNTNSDLVNAVYQSDANIKSGLYYNLVPEDINIVMPYVVFDVMTVMQNNEFCDSFDTAILSFKIYDENSCSTVENITELINTTFNRQNLTYSDASDIGCIRTDESFPVRLEDCWMGKIDFSLTYN